MEGAVKVKIIIFRRHTNIRELTTGYRASHPKG
jgi:hypothetical protein